MDEPARFCTFRVGAQWLGAPVERVQEVLPRQAWTRMPLAPPTVIGLINLRGQIVPTIDMRQRLELPAAADAGGKLDLIVRAHDGLVSLVVDEMGDVVEPADGAIEPTPLTERGAVRAMIAGAWWSPKALVLMLDIDQLLDITPATSAWSAPASPSSPSAELNEPDANGPEERPTGSKGLPS